MTINSIKFYDNEPVSESEKEQSEAGGSVADFKNVAFDLLHHGNVDVMLLKDEKRSRAFYNDKLLKYNSKFA